MPEKISPDCVIDILRLFDEKLSVLNQHSAYRTNKAVRSKEIIFALYQKYPSQEVLAAYRKLI